MFTTSESPNIRIPILQIFAFIYWRGKRKHFFIGPKYFLDQIFGDSDVVNKLHMVQIFCSFEQLKRSWHFEWPVTECSWVGSVFWLHTRYLHNYCICRKKNSTISFLFWNYDFLHKCQYWYFEDSCFFGAEDLSFLHKCPYINVMNISFFDQNGRTILSILKKRKSFYVEILKFYINAIPALVWGTSPEGQASLL